MGNRVLFLFSSSTFTLAEPNANTNNIWHAHAAPFARPLANLQENCKANSAAALLPLCLLAPGQIFAISWRLHFRKRECMTESNGETLSVSRRNIGFVESLRVDCDKVVPDLNSVWPKERMIDSLWFRIIITIIRSNPRKLKVQRS